MKEFEVVTYTGRALEAAIRLEQKHIERLRRAYRSPWGPVRAFLKDLFTAALFVAGMCGAVWAAAVVISVIETMQ